MLDDDEWTPARATAKTWGWVPFGLNAVAASLVIAGAFAAGVTLIVYLLIPAGNAIDQKNIKNGYSNTVNSQGYQQNLQAEMEQNLSNITGPGGLAETRQQLTPGSGEDQVVRSQELAQVRKLCAEGAQLNFSVVADTSLQGTYQQNCAAGTAVADPPLAPAK